jgi:hypothetical protein
MIRFVSCFIVVFHMALLQGFSTTGVVSQSVSSLRVNEDGYGQSNADLIDARTKRQTRIYVQTVTDEQPEFSGTLAQILAKEASDPQSLHGKVIEFEAAVTSGGEDWGIVADIDSLGTQNQTSIVVPYLIFEDFDNPMSKTQLHGVKCYFSNAELSVSDLNGLVKSHALVKIRGRLAGRTDDAVGKSTNLLIEHCVIVPPRPEPLDTTTSTEDERRSVQAGSEAFENVATKIIWGMIIYFVVLFCWTFGMFDGSEAFSGIVALTLIAAPLWWAYYWWESFKSLFDL